MKERPLIWRVFANRVNKQLRTADKWLSPVSSVRNLLTFPQLKNCHVYKHIPVSRTALIILYKMRKGERAFDWAFAM